MAHTQGLAAASGAREVTLPVRAGRSASVPLRPQAARSNPPRVHHPPRRYHRVAANESKCLGKLRPCPLPISPQQEISIPRICRKVSRSARARKQREQAPPRAPGPHPLMAQGPRSPGEKKKKRPLTSSNGLPSGSGRGEDSLPTTWQPWPSTKHTPTAKYAQDPPKKAIKLLHGEDQGQD